MPPTTPTDSFTNNYALGHNFSSAYRLNAQHYIWQQELQFHLHPEIPPPSDGARIVDLAAGTGAWLIEIARAFPKVQFDGFDISLSQCPAKQCLPSNVDFNVWDILSDPPEELIGKYDVVHLRLVTAVIELAAIKDPILILKNVAKLLKPGGWLQWDEVDFTHTVVFPEDGGFLKIDGMKKMDMVLKTASSVKWIPTLPEMINSNGFEDAKYHQFRPRIELMRFNTDTTLGVFVEIATSVRDPERKKFYLGLVEEAWEECQKGASYSQAKAVFVARKKF